MRRNLSRPGRERIDRPRVSASFDYRRSLRVGRRCTDPENAWSISSATRAPIGCLQTSATPRRASSTSRRRRPPMASSTKCRRAESIIWQPDEATARDDCRCRGAAGQYLRRHRLSAGHLFQEGRERIDKFRGGLVSGVDETYGPEDNPSTEYAYGRPGPKTIDPATGVPWANDAAPKLLIERTA
jgi:hypothetical protein